MPCVGVGTTRQQTTKINLSIDVYQGNIIHTSTKYLEHEGTCKTVGYKGATTADI